MQYWLHRIAHLEHVSYPLLDKGYLSIGFSEFCTGEFFEMVAQNKDWDYLENDFNACWDVCQEIDIICGVFLLK